MVSTLQGPYWVKEAVEPPALLPAEGGVESRFAVPEPEDWGGEAGAGLEGSLPVVPVPVPVPVFKMEAEPLTDPEF